MLQKGVRTLMISTLREQHTPHGDELAKKRSGDASIPDSLQRFKHMPVPLRTFDIASAFSDKAKSLLGWRPGTKLDYIVNDSLAFIREKLPHRNRFLAHRWRSR